jgi:hypothetical protein
MENRPRKEKKRPGRKPGSKARHGGYSLMMRGILPEKRRYIGQYLTAVREGWIHDLAAKEENLSTAQRVLIDRAITFLGVVRLIEENGRERGILDSRGRLSQGLTGHYLSFNRFIKETMALLGLEKRSLEPEATLAEIIKKYDKEEAETKAGEASESLNKATGAPRTGDSQGGGPMGENKDAGGKPS